MLNAHIHAWNCFPLNSMAGKLHALCMLPSTCYLNGSMEASFILALNFDILINFISQIMATPLARFWSILTFPLNSMATL